MEFGELFYRQLEIEKSVAFKVEKGNFDANMTLSDKARSDIHWWISNAHFSNKVINHGSIDLVRSTDASLLGWGAFLGQKTAGGRWSNVEKEHHINYLELKAVLLGLQSLCSSVSNSHVKVLTDNTTAVAYIRNMGGTRSIECNEMAREIWLWCKEKQIWLSVSHIPGVDNVLADAASRVLDDTTEWELQEAIYAKITKRWGLPDIDMFASRLNYQTLPYVAWGPDPQAIAADAFTLNWDSPLIYAFPPFSLIAPVLQKIQEDHAEVIIVVPQWTAQPWYSLLVKMLIDRPILLPQDENILYLPFNQNKSHPLGKTQIDGLSVIRSPLKDRGVSQSAQELILNSWRDGTQKQYRTYWKEWQTFACEQSVNPFCPPVNKVLDFLTALYDPGLGYSGINTARCALSLLIVMEGHMTIGKHPLVPRYQNTWDTNKVLQHLKTFPCLQQINLRDLTYKLTMLCALVTGQRCQSLHLMNLDTMEKSSSSYRFVINALVKQSAPGRAQPVLVLPKFVEDKSLCVYSVLEEYV